MCPPSWQQSAVGAEETGRSNRGEHLLALNSFPVPVSNKQGHSGLPRLVRARQGCPESGEKETHGSEARARLAELELLVQIAGLSVS